MVLGTDARKCWRAAGLSRLLVPYFFAASLRCQASSVAGVTRKTPSPAAARYKPSQRSEPGPVSGLVPHSAGMAAQHCVLVPEHKQFSILRPVATEHQDSQADYRAHQQVDDLQQHPASQPSLRPIKSGDSVGDQAFEYSGGTRSTVDPPQGFGRPAKMRHVPRITINELLAEARRGLTRLDPAGALEAMRSGAALIDIRSDSQIARDGTITGALVIPRNALEWRLDPASQHRHPSAPQLGDQVILLCDEGCQSSLAAATLQQLGFARATDVEGGFQAWRAAALPVEPPGASR